MIWNNSSENLEKDKLQDPETDLPTWLKDKQSNQSNDSLPDNNQTIEPEDIISNTNDSTNSGWQKEIEAIITDSTKPIMLDGSQVEKQAIANDIAPASKDNPDDNSLPEWLDLVIKAEEENDTTQLNLKETNPETVSTEGSEIDPSNTESEVQTNNQDEIDSTPTFLTPEIMPETKPLFINIGEESPSTEDAGSKDFRIDLINNLLLRAETDKVSAIGQEIIKDKKSIEELSELLTLWLTDNPESVGIWHLLGDAYMHLNRPIKALKSYSKASQLLSR